MAGVLLVAVPAHAAGERASTRFPLRDRAPFNALFGIGAAWPERGGPLVELSWDIASHATAQETAGEALLLDGETHVLTLRVQQQVSRRLTLGLELPWLAHGGGFMDGVIDRWHDALGLSEGIRPQLGTDDLRFVYVRNGAEAFRLDDATSGFGDLRTSAAWRAAEGLRGGAALDVVASLEWDTGAPGRLTGSGGSDLAAGLRLSAPAGDETRLGWSLLAGVLWPGSTDLRLPEPAGRIWYYDAALTWTALPALDLTLQAAGHGGVYRSGIDTLGGAALQFGGGLRWRFAERYSLRFGVFEDVRTDVTPDFASELSLLYTPD